MRLTGQHISQCDQQRLFGFCHRLFFFFRFGSGLDGMRDLLEAAAAGNHPEVSCSLPWHDPKRLAEECYLDGNCSPFFLYFVAKTHSTNQCSLLFLLVLENHFVFSTEMKNGSLGSRGVKHDAVFLDFHSKNIAASDAYDTSIASQR